MNRRQRLEELRRQQRRAEYRRGVILITATVILAFALVMVAHG